MIKSSATLIFLLSTSLLAKKSLNDVKIVRYTDKQACFEAKPCENKLTLKNVEKLYGKKVQINYISNLPGLKDYSSKKVKQLREEDILQFFKKEKDSFSLTVTAEPGTKSHFGITFSDIYKKLSEKIIYARSKASISNEALDMSKIKYKKNEKVPIAFLDFMYKEDPVDIKVYKV